MAESHVSQLQIVFAPIFLECNRFDRGSSHISIFKSVYHCIIMLCNPQPLKIGKAKVRVIEPIAELFDHITVRRVSISTNDHTPQITHPGQLREETKANLHNSVEFLIVIASRTFYVSHLNEEVVAFTAPPVIKIKSDKGDEKLHFMDYKTV